MVSALERWISSTAPQILDDLCAYCIGVEAHGEGFLEVRDMKDPRNP